MLLKVWQKGKSDPASNMGFFTSRFSHCVVFSYYIVYFFYHANYFKGVPQCGKRMCKHEMAIDLYASTLKYRCLKISLDFVCYNNPKK